MKKNYESVEINVISLEETDVITASDFLSAKLGLSGIFGGKLDLGDFGHQEF